MDADDIDRLGALGGVDGSAPSPASGGQREDSEGDLDRLSHLMDQQSAPAELDMAALDRLGSLGQRRQGGQAAGVQLAFARHSPEAAAHARNALTKLRSERALAASAAQLHMTQEGLSKVARSFPQVVKAFDVAVPVAKRPRAAASSSSSGAGQAAELDEET